MPVYIFSEIPVSTDWVWEQELGKVVVLFFFHEGQAEAKTSARRAVTFNAYLSAMSFDHRLHDCQPKTVAFDLIVAVVSHTIKTIEDVWQISCRDAVACILNVDLDCAFLIH